MDNLSLLCYGHHIEIFGLTDAEYRIFRNRYDFLMNTELELWMFVPAGLYSNVIDIGNPEYETYKSHCLFKDFEVIKKGRDGTGNYVEISHHDQYTFMWPQPSTSTGTLYSNTAAITNIAGLAYLGNVYLTAAGQREFKVPERFIKDGGQLAIDLLKKHIEQYQNPSI